MAIEKVSFTTNKINSLGCEPGKSQTIYWDSRTPNFGLRVTPSGSKSFIFETTFNDKTLRITIGDVKTWAIDKAQSEARRLKVLTYQGIDPREQKADLKAKEELKKYKERIKLERKNNKVEK